MSLMSLFCIIFASVFSEFLSTHSSSDFIESLLCLFVVAKRCPLSLSISCDLLRRSNGKKGAEDGLSGHVTGGDVLGAVQFSFCGFADQRQFGFFWPPFEDHASQGPLLPFLTSSTVTSQAPSVATIYILTVLTPPT